MLFFSVEGSVRDDFKMPVLESDMYFEQKGMLSVATFSLLSQTLWLVEEF